MNETGIIGYEMFCTRILNEFEVKLGCFSALALGLQKIVESRFFLKKPNDGEPKILNFTSKDVPP